MDTHLEDNPPPPRYCLSKILNSVSQKNLSSQAEERAFGTKNVSHVVFSPSQKAGQHPLRNLQICALWPETAQQVQQQASFFAAK